MSPEQAEGKPADARSDIFSFGAVLYEMVTGRRAFTGESTISTLSAVLHQEPKPLDGLPRDLETCIRRCLRKDPDKRFQHMDDVRVALEELKAESESGTLSPAAPSPARARPRRRLAWAVAVVSVMLVAAVVGMAVVRATGATRADETGAAHDIPRKRNPTRVLPRREAGGLLVERPEGRQLRHLRDAVGDGHSGPADARTPRRTACQSGRRTAAGLRLCARMRSRRSC